MHVADSLECCLQVDVFRDFKAESAEGTENGPGGGSGGSGLSQLFKPPKDLLFEGGFDMAKMRASQEGKWLLLNLQQLVAVSQHGLHAAARGFPPRWPACSEGWRACMCACMQQLVAFRQGGLHAVRAGVHALRAGVHARVPACSEGWRACIMFMWSIAVSMPWPHCLPHAHAPVLLACMASHIDGLTHLMASHIPWPHTSEPHATHRATASLTATG
eukprot:366214-Chlamydomonas_euryale.AAC.7